MKYCNTCVAKNDLRSSIPEPDVVVAGQKAGVRRECRGARFTRVLCVPLCVGLWLGIALGVGLRFSGHRIDEMQISPGVPRPFRFDGVYGSDNNPLLCATADHVNTAPLDCMDVYITVVPQAAFGVSEISAANALCRIQQYATTANYVPVRTYHVPGT